MTEINDLISLLQRSPVMGKIHPLVPLCLPPAVEVVANPSIVAEELDSVHPHTVRPILITTYDPRYEPRFTLMHFASCPPPEAFADNLPARTHYARTHLLTHERVAERITADAVQRNYAVVALMLVDGLCYDDVKDWPEHVEPCFVDGPSVTYGRTSDGGLIPTIGFPSIVGRPSLARRLIDVGIRRSRGFSYWNREKNDVSAYLYEGVPLTRVGSMAEALTILGTPDLRGTYIQLVREGLDGLAHRRREISSAETSACVNAIRYDYQKLIGVLASSGLRGAAYLVSDHGILWRDQHALQRADELRLSHPRYGTNSTTSSRVNCIQKSGQGFVICHYPVLAAEIRSNDSGVHGGLSYWESLVPFVRVEVNV